MSKKRLKKGFTIIELIVVIAVLGVLVLLALPKFLDYTEKAKIAQIKSDIVAKEKFIDSKRVQNDDYIKDWEKVDVATMESLKKSLFNKKGLISNSNEVSFGGEYYKVPKGSELVKTNLKGDFYLGQGGEVYYYDENLAHKISGDGNNGGNGGNNGGNGDGDNGGSGQPPVTEKFTVTFKDYYGNVIETKTVEKGQEIEPPLVDIKGYTFSGWDKDLTNITSDVTTKALFSQGPTDKDLGYSDSDFIWVKDYYYGYINKNGERGYFEYRGTGRSTVEIPHVIQGVQMTSYYYMFYKSPSEVTKVISTNKNVTDMSYMFSKSQATSIDLSNFNTSNVKNMFGMFKESQTETLDLSSFDTSNVTNMNNMFRDSQAKSIDLSNFNTSTVKSMEAMFYGSHAETLDLSSFDTSNVTNMSLMFYNNIKTTTVYARTQEEVFRLSSGGALAPQLTFIVKK